MAPRSSWKGYLRLSLVSVPVEAINASVTGGGKIHFHQLHATCHNRIRYQKICPIHGEVSSSEIVYGFEHAKGQYVVVDDEDVDKLRSAADKAISIDTFVSPQAIDPSYFDGRTYYLLPDGPMGQKPYAVLLKALADKPCYGIGRAVFSGREQPVAVRPYGGVLCLEMLHYASQLRSPETVASETLPEVTKEELRLATKLIEASTSSRFDIEAYQDTYTDKLRAVIEAKVAGKEVVGPPKDEEAPVINLMEALRRSVAQTRRAPTKRAASTSRAKPARLRRTTRSRHAG